MKILLTGGAGISARLWCPDCSTEAISPVILDIRAPPDLQHEGMFIQGSVLDRSKLKEHFRGCDCIVHIAAWHGIHEVRGEKNAYDFFDLNVRGTFEVFEAAASLGIDKIDIHFHNQRSPAGHTVRAQQDFGRAYCRGLCKAQQYERDHPPPARVYSILEP